MKLNYKEQKKRFLELAELINKAGEVYTETLLNSDISVRTLMREYEKKGDKIRDELNSHFISQQDIPYLALDRAKLLRKIDDTLDEYLTAENIYFSYQSSLPANFSNKIIDAVTILKQMNDLIAKSISTIFENFKQTLDFTDEIEVLRDKFIDTTYLLEKSYFTEENNWKEFTAASKILKANIRCANAIKIVSEVLAQMTYTYL